MENKNKYPGSLYSKKKSDKDLPSSKKASVNSIGKKQTNVLPEPNKIIDKKHIREIEKYIKNEKVLKEKISFYEKIFSTVGAIILIMNFDNYELLYINNADERILGYKYNKKDYSAQKLIDAHHPEDQNLLAEMKEFFKVNRNNTFSAIYSIKDSDGKYRWVMNTSRLFNKNHNNPEMNVISVIQDLTGNLSYDKNLKNISKEKFRKINAQQVGLISQRERQIVKLFANGFKSKEIAEKLDISFHTVNNHRKNILKKLNLKNLAALVNFAVENGLD
ncbi:MAG: PAS domain-containing protein [Bacteroidales bacterium]|nr:PAS domain-containing protein [Bacteroidales bacterium]